MTTFLQYKSPTSGKELKSFPGAKKLHKFYPYFKEKTNQMRQLLRNKSESNWTEIKEDFNEIKKMIRKNSCLAHFAGDRDYIVTTDASRTGLGLFLMQKQNDNTIRPKLSATRYLNDAEKNYWIGELEQLAIV